MEKSKNVGKNPLKDEIYLKNLISKLTISETKTLNLNTAAMYWKLTMPKTPIRYFL